MGLRVLVRDGRAAGASPISARTVLRLIDDGPIGLVVMVASGRRRQRIGDLLGGTIVARDTPGLPPAPLSPMILVYPVAWAIGAIALAIPAPEGMQGLRAEILALDDDVDGALRGAIARASASPDPRRAFQAELPGVLERQRRRRARYAELGMPVCAGLRAA